MSQWKRYGNTLVDIDAFSAFGVTYNYHTQRYEVWAASGSGGKIVLLSCKTEEDAEEIIDQIAKQLRGFV